MINWSNYFNQIYCIHFLPNKDRKSHIDAQFKRVGISDSGILKYHYTFPNKLERTILNTIPLAHQESYSTPRGILELSLSSAFYAIWQESLWLGYQHVLIVEDDAVFVDTGSIQTALDHLPYDWDYIHFDNILCKRENYRLSTLNKGEFYHSNYTGGYWGTCMTAFSAQAMKIAIPIIEDKIWPADYVLENRDDDSLNVLKRYAYVYNIVHQIGQNARYNTILF